MEIDLILRGYLADLLERLHRAKFVVRVHDRDEHGFRSNRSPQLLKINQAVRIHWQVGEGDAGLAFYSLGTFLFECLAGVQDSFVLYLCRDHMRGSAGTWSRDTKDSVIVGFSAATCEHNFLSARANERSNLFACGFNGRTGTLTRRVDRSSVAEIVRKIWEHRVKDLRVDRSGGVVIEVDAGHGAIS